MANYAVIGANYGDEGKGLMTDYLVSKLEGNVAVVRFNGGAQAGHTVETPDGKRHVFSHYGAGVFHGATTILGPKFVLNPLLFAVELAELRILGIKGHIPVAYHPDCYITTPYDVAINRAVEISRGKSKHGSVGVGFGETIERCSNGYNFKIDPTMSAEEFMEMFSTWTAVRCAELGISINVSKEECQAFLLALDDFYMIADEGYNLDNYEHLVFEGAQGLLLDMDKGEFPYVTRSNTGIKNIVDMIGETDILHVYYVTRSYVTRHGAGPLEREVNVQVTDETNQPNQWQGSLRVGLLDYDAMSVRCMEDMLHHKKSLPYFVQTWGKDDDKRFDLMFVGKTRDSVVHSEWYEGI